MKKTMRFLPAAVLVLGAIAWAPGVLEAKSSKAKFECLARCPEGLASCSGWFCSCHCDAAGNPSCSCVF
jgi:hypothetical protein